VVCATTRLFRSALSRDGDRAMSEIESTRGPILLLSADDDQVWPSALLAERAMTRLSRWAHPVGDEWLSYPDAGHGATLLPGDPTTDPAILHPSRDIWLEQGGPPKAMRAPSATRGARSSASSADTWPDPASHWRTSLGAMVGCNPQ
jgi:hypothetical protein